MDRSFSNALLSGQERQFVGWAAIDEFENLFSRLCDCPLFMPKFRPSLPRQVEQVRNRIFGEFVAVKSFVPAGDLLLVVARAPANLGLLQSLNEAKKKFRYVAGFVIDSYFLEGFASVTKRFDHVFTTTDEGAETVRRRFGVPSSVLRQGFDCLNWSSTSGERSIDIIGFGRQPPSYHKALQERFHKRDPSALYLHSPIGTISGEAVRLERPMMLKLLQRAKISLAFHLDVEPQGARPRASTFVTSRWLESLAAGCAIMGRRPLGSMADEMFSWPDATIELQDPRSAPDAIEELLSSPERLSAIRSRNVREMCSHHDWRYRIRDIYNHFSLPLPPALQDELLAINRLCEQLELSSR